MRLIGVVLFFFCGHVTGQVIDKVALLNSKLDEQNPVLSPDGKTLYFTVSNHEQNVGGKKDLGDIWYSTLTEAGWTTPVHAGAHLNNIYHNAVAGFSADGRQLILMGHYSPNGQPVQSQGLSISTRQGEGWSAPGNVVIPYFKNKTPFQSGALSATGRVLVFSAESYTTVGAEDLYVSTQSASGHWSEPKNLGRAINTPMQDVSPSLSADGKRLYFASNGRQGFGSFDIFYSDRLDDTWQNWSEPVNIGTPINTEGRELFFRTFSEGDFYTSTQNSDGYGDIRFFPHNEPLTANVKQEIVAKTERQPDTVTQISEIVYEERAGEIKSVRLLGKVVNAKTNEGVAAAIHFISEEKSLVVTSSETGVYHSSLPGVHDYHIKVEAPGLIGVLEKLDLRTQVLSEVEMNFKLQPIEVGTTVNLKSVLFQQSTAILLKESYDELDMVADFMLINPNIEIELAGHTDNRGYHQLNMKLSRERVDEVKKYLISKGIEARRISGRGYGGIKPIADNDSDETRQLNRRVEFTILKD